MLWMFLLFIILLLCALITLDERKKRKFQKLFERYKFSLRYWPFVGQGLAFLCTNGEEQMKIFVDAANESYTYGGLLGCWIANRFYLYITNADVAENILKKCSCKDDVTSLIHLVSGYGSIFAPVPIWRPRRKLVAPTFCMKNLTEFVKTFDEQSKIMIDCMKDIGHEPVSISEYLIRYSLDAVCENTLGVKMQAQTHPNHDFLKAMEKVFKLTMERLTRPWLYNERLYKILPVYKHYSRSRGTVHNFVKEVIKAHKLSTSQHSEKNDTNTFLAHFMQSGNISGDINDTVLMEESLVIILAGTDTSSVAASFTALMLARHPHVQDTCYQELLEVFGNSDNPVTVADLRRLKYLEAVINETMRLYPPAPIITRKIENDFNIATGDTLPKGCGILISIYGLHRNPSYWGADADQFRPERFLHSELRQPAAFMPFSTGPRNCLGYQYAMLSLKTVLARLILQYRLLAAAAGAEPPPIRLQNDLMLRDGDGFQLRVQARQPANTST